MMWHSIYQKDSGGAKLRGALRPAFLASLAVLALAAAGCQMPPQKPTFPALTYAYEGPIVFNVGRVDVVSTFVSPMKPPDVEYQAPVPPVQAMMQWGHDRLKAAGGPGVVKLTVTDGRIVDVPLPMKSGIEGFFTKQQSDRYDATLAAEIAVYDDQGNQLGFVRTQAQRSRTVEEGTPPAERDKILFDLTDSLMKEMDKSLDQAIRSHLSRFVELP